MGRKIPISTLVLVYTRDLDVLLIERADFPGHWQSVTGSQEPGESLLETATRELREETGIDANAYGGLADWRLENVYEIFPQWRHRYPPGTTHNTEHVFALEVPAAGSGGARPAGAPAARVAAVAGGRREVLLVVEPRRDTAAAAARAHPPRLTRAAVPMTRR